MLQVDNSRSQGDDTHQAAASLVVCNFEHMYMVVCVLMVLQKHRMQINCIMYLIGHFFSLLIYEQIFTTFCSVDSLCDVHIVNFPYVKFATALQQAFKILPTGSTSSLGVRPNKLQFPLESSFTLSYNLASLLFLFAWLDLPKIVAECSDTDGPYFLGLVLKLPRFCDCPL